MNRTFSLNNVADIGQQAIQSAVAQSPAIHGIHHQATILSSSNGSNTPISMLNNSHNVVLPLTQASLAAVSSTSSFNMMHHNQHTTPNMFSINEESIMRLSNKLSSKYASSNFLADNTGCGGSGYPTKTRTQPRRRNPRNAEEFLIAAGVTDTDNFLSKGYYVGSMLNLSEITAKSFGNETQQSTNKNNSYNNQNNNSSSSSSSTMNYFKTSNGNNNNEINQLAQTETAGYMSSLKRRNSIQDTNSVSMANLAYQPAFAGKTNGHGRPKLYAKNQLRSMTTAIVQSTTPSGPTESELDYSSLQNEGTVSNPTSGGGSDSSASPTPSLPHNQVKMGSLGPLMRAVSTLSPKNSHFFMENNSNNNNNNNNNNINTSKFSYAVNHSNEDEVDEYDEYEYLERNLGAEPDHHVNKALAISKTDQSSSLRPNTNITQVTDYFTDESASCHNEDFNTSIVNGNKMNGGFPNTFMLPATPSPSSNQYHSSNINSARSVQSQYQATFNNLTLNRLKENVNALSNNSNANLSVGGGGVNGGWDHASVTSNNSLFSGLYLINNNQKNHNNRLLEIYNK